MPFAGTVDLRRFRLPTPVADGRRSMSAGATHFRSEGLRFQAAGPSSAWVTDRLLIVLDGRIDNLRELREGSGLPDASAAMLIASNWQLWGTATLDRLLGDFALVAIEPAMQRITLARDPTGQRPLFHAVSGHQLSVASTPRLLAELGHPLRPDLASLAGRLQEREGDPADSGFEGVRRCLPGHLVEFADAGERTVRWWRPRAEPDPVGPTRDYPAEYRQHLHDAVACRAGLGLVATHLSAGWDSSAVTAAAARVAAPDRLLAFTAAPLGPVQTNDRHALPDETGIAGQTAASLGIRHRLERPAADPFAVAAEVIRETGVPVRIPFQLAWWRAIEQAARAAGASTLLTGELGNLGLNASGLGMLPLLLRQREWRRWWSEVQASAAAGTLRRRGALAASFGGHLPRWLMIALDRRLGGGTLAVPTDFLRPEWRGTSGAALPDDPYQARRALIGWNDSGSMRELAERQFGLAESDPTSDRRILEWSLTLPVEAFLHGGVLRPVARAALSTRVSPAVLANRRRGMQAADWYRQVDAPRCLAVLDRVADVPGVRELLDIDAMHAAIRAWPSSDWNIAENYSRYRVGLAGALCIGLFIAEFSRPAERAAA
jgi:asparagine synthase (glutamine-hydrolysing)